MGKEKIIALKKRNYYLERYAWPSIGLHEKITGNPDLIVVIPAYAEKAIVTALNSLNNCTLQGLEVAIIVIVNEPENADKQVSAVNRTCLEEIEAFNSKYQLQSAFVKLPNKKAGVGSARKIGLDEAVRAFEKRQKDGILVCFDADCTCSPNYLQAISNYFQNPTNRLGMLYFEHDLKGLNSEAIVSYELFLRYYINAMRVSGYPLALQTLGSCITVRSSAYQKQGGMNTRKAGEDFYFIHKVSPLGGVGEINAAVVYPSDRISYRVPFGTGFAIHKYQEQPNTAYPSYNYRIFEDLVFINSDLEELYETSSIKNRPDTLSAFYVDNELPISKIVRESGSFKNFKQRYYQWWDPFKVMKFIHHTRDHFYPNAPLQDGIKWLSSQLSIDIAHLATKDQLSEMRAYDRNHAFYIK